MSGNNNSERLILRRADDWRIITELKRVGVEIDERQLREFVVLTTAIGGPDDKWEHWTEPPMLPPGTIGLIFPKTHYNVNVSRATLQLAATLIDAMQTSGLATLALNLSGIAGKSIARLDPTTAEPCVLVNAAKLKQRDADVSPLTVASMTSDIDCPYPTAGCKFMIGRKCTADHEALESVFQSLKDKGALEKTGDVWTVPL